MENKPQSNANLPELCKKCQSFYANPKLDSHCSKCYKELDIQKPNQKDANNEAIAQVCSTEKEEEKEVPIQQTNHSLCWTCEKKAGLMGFKCKCGYTFCKRHRIPEKHSCEFDFKKDGKKQLSKTNKQLVHDKIEKI